VVAVPGIRLRGLAESPGSFTATLAEEADRDEHFWPDRMTRPYRLLAEQGELPQGIVSPGPDEQDPTTAEVFSLYVVPEAPSTGVSWRPSRPRRIWQSRPATHSCTTAWAPTCRLSDPIPLVHR
jgi:hypothetical protein